MLTEVQHIFETVNNVTLHVYYQGKRVQLFTAMRSKTQNNYFALFCSVVVYFLSCDLPDELLIFGVEDHAN